MLVQYLVPLEATNLRVSKKYSVKAVNSPQGSKEKTFHVHLLVLSLFLICSQVVRPNFGLVFLQNCSYKKTQSVYGEKWLLKRVENIRLSLSSSIQYSPKKDDQMASLLCVERTASFLAPCCILTENDTKKSFK